MSVECSGGRKHYGVKERKEAGEDLAQRACGRTGRRVGIQLYACLGFVSQLHFSSLSVEDLILMRVLSTCGLPAAALSKCEVAWHSLYITAAKLVSLLKIVFLRGSHVLLQHHGAKAVV